MKSYKRLTIAQFVLILLAMFNELEDKNEELMFFTAPFGEGLGVGIKFYNFHDNLFMLVGGYGCSVEVMNLGWEWTMEQFKYEVTKFLKLNYLGLNAQYVYMEVEDKTQ